MGFQEKERQVANKWSKKGSPYNSYNKLSYGLEREVPTKIHFTLIALHCTKLGTSEVYSSNESKNILSAVEIEYSDSSFCI